MLTTHKNNSSIYENIMIIDKEHGGKNDTKLFTLLSEQKVGLLYCLNKRLVWKVLDLQKLISQINRKNI